MALTISELARSAGVGVETVRFYQRKGLLFDPRPALASGSGTRHYGESEIRRLRFIRSAQSAGFTLEEIKQLLELDRTQDRARARDMARTRVAALDAKIEELQAARRALADLAQQCSATTEGPCPIIAAFD